jgi:beta-carotene 15,15'-dioxygenase
VTLSVTKGGGDVFATQSQTARIGRSIRAPWSGRNWRPGFERVHWRAIVALLAVLLGLGTIAPAMLMGSLSGAVLLIGGALIGMPHGSSDFVVAHRVLKPRLNRWWLPAFLAAYLALTALALLGWRIAPTTTFVAFLAISALHFGASRDDPVRSGPSVLRYIARSCTPVVPIFLFHPADVAGIIGLMCGRPPETIVSVLIDLRPVGLGLYLAMLAILILRALRPASETDPPNRTREVIEHMLLAAAAYLLPPLLVFAVYFCLLHAVRHMAELGHDTFPRDGRAALALAAAIVVPSALVCLAVLSFAWDAIAGVLTTEHLLALALQVTASLTVPHVILESWAGRQTARA